MDEFKGLEFEKPILDLDSKIAEIRSLSSVQSVNLVEEIKSLEENSNQLMQEIFSSLTPWQRVQLARHPRRPHTSDYIQSLFTDFIELHGDRNFADDPALVGGCAFLGEKPVMVLGHQKGRTFDDAMLRNFGMMHPEGYRKALRLMQMAEKFNRPIITFIDTPGAYPGIGAEERGQAEAIARNLREMSQLEVPVVSVVIGEGGSGGALGIGVTDRILMLENAWYSVISPEGCAAILFRDSARASDAATALKLTAENLNSLGIIDEIVPEPLGGAQRDFSPVVASLQASLSKHLTELQSLSTEELLEKRYQKYRKMGVWKETIQKKAGTRTQKKAENGSRPKSQKNSKES
ncbi:MAG: acetyl-CoA carboxylase carboxyltransferase subunit alpha [Elusimicrobia bacterium]|nr:acetyl-CoA carboxylase carboxyltransferase subunit alpha [Elusimicrobiota bacterium]